MASDERNTPGAPQSNEGTGENKRVGRRPRRSQGRSGRQPAGEARQPERDRQGKREHKPQPWRQSERKPREEREYPETRPGKSTRETGQTSPGSEKPQLPRKAKGKFGRRRRPTGIRRWSVGRAVTLVVIAALLAIVLWRLTMMGPQGRDTITYTELSRGYLDPGRVRSIRIIGDRLEATVGPAPGNARAGKKRVYLGTMQLTPDLVSSWVERGIDVEFRPSSSAWQTLLNALPYIAILVVIFFLFRQAQTGPRGIFSFGKSRARELTENAPTITFAEVAGVEEAKQELQEIVEFLKEPERFQRLGGKIPRGVLMVGPPGTGKTYLARAVAGEAGVPFFNISGSDFVEMFVGVGASRVRDLFERAKVKAPCIVFIDEIDAVGRHRGAGLGGGHDEREQTLNQLLVEMDGFNTASTVILIAATNRPDVLDPALLRPGRFDRQIVIDMPDVRGREGILKIHSRNVPLAKDVDLTGVARGTPGLSGADLRNLVNEAALLAARSSRRDVGMQEIESAKEKILWGVERRSLVMTEEERRVTAIHEAGHALAALFTPEGDAVHKVMIVPRGRALGLTSYLPDERHTISRSWCEGKLVSIIGGRAAEELVIGEITNGAANDLEIATGLARRMVCEWGMSARLGPVTVGGKDVEIFIGRDLVQSRAVSEETLQIIDEEVRRVVDEGLARARAILEENRAALDALAAELLVREVLDRRQIDRIVQPFKGRSGTITETISSVRAPQGPVVVERDAQLPPAPPRKAAQPRAGRCPERPERAAAADTRELRRPARTEEPERVRQPDVEELAVPVRNAAVIPTPQETEQRTVSPVEHEQVLPTSKPLTFGRKPKTVRRSALPSSEVPAAGIPVSSVVRWDVLTYGRHLRPADDGGGNPKLETPDEEARAQAGPPVETVGVRKERAADVPSAGEPSTTANDSLADPSEVAVVVDSSEVREDLPKSP